MLFHWWWNLSNLHIYSIKRNGLPFLSIKFLDWLAICENSKTKILKYAWFTISHQLKIPVACFTSEWAERTQCIGNPFPHQLCSKRRFFRLAYSSKDFAKNHVKVSRSSLYTQYSRYTLSTIGTAAAHPKAVGASVGTLYTWIYDIIFCQTFCCSH